MFSFANPWLLLLIILPWLFQRLLPAGTASATPALRIPFFSTLIAGEKADLIGHLPLIKTILAYSLWGLLIIALAGPQWLGPTIAVQQNGRDIMLAVDLSGSMQLPDMMLNDEPTDRITVVKKVASNFISHREGDRIGLILFASRPYLQAPFTFDRQTVMQLLDDATIGLAGTQTAIGDAIGLAIKKFMDQNDLLTKNNASKNRVLILLTDGANNEGTLQPINAAVMAKQAGIRIYTIGLGSTKAMINNFSGPAIANTDSDLDEKSLKEIATITGGMFFRAENTNDLNNVYKTLDQLEPIAHNSHPYRPIQPLYPFPLGAALLLSLYFALRRIHFFHKQIIHHPTSDAHELGGEA